MVFAFRKYQYSLTNEALHSITRRVVLLFLLGLFLNWFGFWDNFSGLRIMGVLQRIGLAYGLAALLVLTCSHRQLYLFAVVVLLGYWLLLYLGGGAQPYALEHNLVRQLDLAFLGEAHMWRSNGVAFDPEGLLSTLPAVITVLSGYLATNYLLQTERRIAMRNLLTCGVLLIAVAEFWDPLFPINKSLWTSSYVLFTTGICLLTLVLLIWLIDILQWSWLAVPLQIYGLNPLFVYALSWMLARLTAVTIILPHGQGGQISSYDWFYQQLAGIFAPMNASLLFAILHVLLFWMISLYLYRKNIVIKI